MVTLRDLVLAKYGSIARAAEALDVARPGLSEALNGHRTCSIWYWRHLAAALELSGDELGALLQADARRTQGGGTLSGSVRCKT